MNNQLIRPAKFNRFLIFMVVMLIFVWIGLPLLIAATGMGLMLHPPCSPGLMENPPFQSITLVTRTGVNIQGWWHPTENGKVVLLLGGQGANRDAMLDRAGMLVRNGYGILSAGYRNCSGKPITLGYTEVEELQTMAEYAAIQPGVTRLMVLGFSVGGATAIRAAARMPELSAVVAEGNYADLHDLLISTQEPVFSHEWQIRQWMAFFYFFTSGVWPSEIRPLADLPKISPRPVMLIHGELELGRTRGREQFAALGEPRYLWVVPGAEHGQYFALAGEEYERRVIGFFDQAQPVKER